MAFNSRYFTLDEAQSLLKELLNDLSRLVELKKNLDEKRYDIYRHEYFGGSGPNGTKLYPPELEELVSIAQRFATEGVMVKSLDEGLIDFPHIRKNGDRVLFCYKLGEDEIFYWHPLESGFAGRRSVTQL
ncbi:MAG: DUF2203 domain-containing protein [Candidatus Kryptoniota bacterium]